MASGLEVPVFDWPAFVVGELWDPNKTYFFLDDI